jgi:predicted RNA-binding protein with PUA-like domain
MQRYWVFLNNPDEWSLDEFLKDGHRKGMWRSGQYANQISLGDLVLFRVGKGKRGTHPWGIYAVCSVVESNCTGYDITEMYWQPEAKWDKNDSTVKLSFELVVKKFALDIDDIRLKLPKVNSQFWDPKGVGHFEISESDFDEVTALMKPYL